jgi:hypothetical protein
MDRCGCCARFGFDFFDTGLGFSSRGRGRGRGRGTAGEVITLAKPFVIIVII